MINTPLEWLAWLLLHYPVQLADWLYERWEARQRAKYGSEWWARGKNYGQEGQP